MEQKKYVLYADDDIDDRDIMEEVFLVYPDYVLLTFPDGTPLLEHLSNTKAESISLIILDMNMTIVSGMQALTAIRQDKAYASIPVVMFTTSSSPIDKTQAAVYGAKVITKPTSIKQLQSVAVEMFDYASDYQK